MYRYNKIILFLFLAISNIAIAQKPTDREKLQQQRARLQDEIKVANQLLDESKKDHRSSITFVETLAQKIRIREQLLRTLEREVELLDIELKKQERQIDELENEVKLQKENYAKMIAKAQENKLTNSVLLFLLSSNDFNQLSKRIEYIRQLSEARRRQVELIVEKENQIKNELRALRLQKVQKERLKAQRVEEKKMMDEEALEQEKLIVELGIKMRDLENEVRKKQNQREKLEKEIQRMIAIEIERAKQEAIRKDLESYAQKIGLIKGKDFSKKTTNQSLKNLIDKREKEMKALAMKQNETKPKENTVNNKQTNNTSEAQALQSTPEAKLLSANFSANKTRLPWPVEKGLIVMRFGKQNHEVAKQVIIDNPGINIATEKGSMAKAVFDGTITGVLKLPEGTIAVLIRHGNYFTVYSNLIDVDVKSGQEIKRGQSLGTVFTDPGDGKTVMHFELWEGSKNLDPTPWLAR
jgi:septal ring factor EnvC (AmiA/AmiB activator)